MSTLLIAIVGGFVGAATSTLIELIVFRILQARGLRLFARAEMTEED